MFELNKCLQPGTLWLVSFCSAIAQGHMLLKGTVLQHLASSLHPLAHLCCSQSLSWWKYICRFGTTAAGFLFCWLSRSLMQWPKTRQQCPVSAIGLMFPTALSAGSQLPGVWHSPSSVGTGLCHAFLLAYGVFICFASPQWCQLSHLRAVGNVPIWCLSIQHILFMLLLQSCCTLGS